jgi:hypothetical protein
VPARWGHADTTSTGLYTSGYNAKAYALLVSDNASEVPTVIVQIDMACVIGLPRAADGHTVVGGNADSCTTLIGPF